MSKEFQIRDDKSFKSYRFDGNSEELEIFTEKKEKMILLSVVQNRVENIKTLLDSPKWYRITDKNGLSLLHIAILQNSKEVFDYILTLEDFPLEMVSDYGETALITAILVIDLDRNGFFKSGTDYFAFELIKRGADIFFLDSFKLSTLSCAALKHHVKMAEFLLKNGVELDYQDVCGNTALHHALDHDSPDCVTFVSVLLCHGADPRIRNKDDLMAFEKAVLRTTNTILWEILFYYTFDVYSGFKTYLSVLLKLAQYESDLVTRFEDVFIDDGSSDYIQMFYLDVEYLKLFLEQFPSVLKFALRLCSLDEWSRNAVTFEKVELFIQSDLKDDLIICIQDIDDHCLFYCLMSTDCDESTLTNIFCYLSSYGLTITAESLQRIYDSFGFCDLFKILLHMDIDYVYRCEKEVMPHLLFDVGMDLQSFLESVSEYAEDTVYPLLHYFVNPKLNEICCELYGNSIRNTISNLPQVPLLVELARNVFRKYFISRFKIESSRRFYTLINALNISHVYKEIITYEKKLY